ncbi:hypothetical protein [Isoptericola sp. NPDC057559]|uniref:hypothetical protein n=1 Tax=Isoptericola sp. NPDC057559 TaxID=3346168 RepID=UPI003678F07A
MPTAAHLAALLEPRLAETPYRVVDVTDDSLTVRIDLADARWWGVLSRHGLRETYELALRADAAAGTYTITETTREVQWSGGMDGPVPHLGAALRTEVFTGTRWSWTRRIVVGFSDHGGVEGVVNYAFSPSPVRAVLTSTAKEAGLRPRRSGSDRFALVAAIAGGGFALLIVLVMVADLVGVF